MRSNTGRRRIRRPRELLARLRSAFGDLLSQEFAYSTGHIATVLNGCLFVPSLLTFWFVNGVIDFSTALAIGAVASPAGLQVRLLAYVLLVPVFLALRMTVYLVHPATRGQVLAGSCPNARYLSLDWFSVGILATGLPLALRDLGPWIGMNLVFLVGIFLLPRLLGVRLGLAVKLAAIAGGSLLFLYANYGAGVPALPDPAAVLGPVATLALPDATVRRLLRAVNSLLLGPLLIAAFGVVMNRVLTRPELREVPLVRHSLPERDPERIVVASAALGTGFYLLVVAAATGRLIVIP